ncbi:AAA family ATPase [Chryseobacterium binzhouense]|uniref:AAA family ATPase n=1 Tax=Chryseobacterium binzhouense TaxID=2593646 RepID=UPI00117FF680|nr:AAA family ATPase [Chryseobacterium binzhouense]
MRLAAVYVKEHFLFSEPQTINLGGKYLYTIIPRKGTENEYDITRVENLNFIKGFWGENISLVSAIVGENGAGKTSVLKEFCTYENNYPNTFFIWEENEEMSFTQIYYNSNTRNKVKLFENNFSINDKSNEILKETQQICFSPFFDYDIEKVLGNGYYSRYINRLNNINSFDMLNKGGITVKTLFLTFGNLLNENDPIDLMSFINNDTIKNVKFCEKFNEFKEKFGFLDYNLVFTNSFISDEKTFDFYRLSKGEKEDINYTQDYLKKAFDSNEKELIIRYYDLKFFLQDKMNYYSERFVSDFYANLIIYIDYYFDGFHDSVLAKVNESNNINLDKIIRELLAERQNNISEKILDLYSTLYNDESSGRIDLKTIINEFYHYKRADAIKIIKLQKEISNLYKKGENAVAEKKLLYYYPDRVLSSGEKTMINLFATIFHPVSEYINNVKDIDNPLKNIKNIILLLDEADLGFHPQWKKKYVKILTDFLPIMFAEIPGFESVQIIFTTHDPLTLSDIPNSNVVYLKKEGEKTKVLSQNEKPKKSFGANITDLLADSFFINDGLIGDFAKGKIEEVIKFLKKEKSEINSKEECKKIIELIDEPLMREKLLEMYYEAFDEEKLKEKELKILEELAKKHNKKITDA